MADQYSTGGVTSPGHKFYYGWVIVAAGTLMMSICYGLMFSYGVFFKPLAEYFDWDRSSLSIIYSAALMIRGGISIGTGWLADKYGARKLMVFCGAMISLGLILSSQVQTLWQFFITYALIEALGLSGAFGVASAMAARWFTKRRGLALGIVSSGGGIGALLIVPVTERLVDAVDWSMAFIISGVIAGALTIAAALFLRMPPENASSNTGYSNSKKTVVKPSHSDLTLSQAIRNPRVILVTIIFTLFLFCIQMIMLHLINYATDIGIDSLVAASFVSIIGASSIAGRLMMGAGADKIGIHNTLLISIAMVVLAMLILTFADAMWALFLFAVIFGFAYGGEITQIPLFMSRCCGTKDMASLVGMVLFIGNIGGALGPWVGGKVFDVTADYQWAFIIGTLLVIIAMVLTLIIRKQNADLKV
jgi:MFS family permease